MIPDEAVEAAARAAWDVDSEPGSMKYEDCRDGTKRHLRREAKAALEAADPALLAVIQEQQVILGRVKALADSWDDKYGPGSNADEVLGPQKVSIRFAVEMIRAALTATEAAQ